MFLEKILNNSIFNILMFEYGKFSCRHNIYFVLDSPGDTP